MRTETFKACTFYPFRFPCQLHAHAQEKSVHSYYFLYFPPLFNKVIRRTFPSLPLFSFSNKIRRMRHEIGQNEKFFFLSLFNLPRDTVSFATDTGHIKITFLSRLKSKQLGRPSKWTQLIPRSDSRCSK